MSGFDPVTIRATIDSAAERIGRVWPLYSDVGANPLSGFEDRPFPDAVAEAERLFGGRGYPQPTWFRAAWESGRIDPDVLESVLEAHGVSDSPATLLDRMEASASDRSRSADSETLDRIVAKWLAAFLDQGQAACPVPNREEGLYRAWRSVAPYDTEIPASSTPVATQYHERLDDLPETAPEAVYAVLSDYPTEDWERIFEHHLAALPGWVGFIKQRAQANNNPWQEACPATLLDYMAIRLILAKHMGEPIDPADEGDADPSTDSDDPPLAELWLTAWERSFRQGLVDDVQQDLAAGRDTNPETPDAQLVFCIDTRSEIIRRHLERTGPYETFGYGGFFGIPLEYEGFESKTRTDSCPVMVDPTHHITERPRTDGGAATAYDRWQRLTRAGTSLMKSLKNDVAAAFGFVEASGSLFGAALTSRTLSPSGVRALRDRLSPPRPESFCDPTIDADADHDHAADLPVGMSTDQRAFYAEAAFDLMGWEEFAPVVVFTGHRSETVNNPYKSSIDCGACAGSPGTPNARTLAAICNDPAVRAELRDRGIEVPEDTVFLAAEHNTTTDDVEIFVTEDLSERQRAVVDRLRDDLETAQTGAAAERLETMDVDAADSVDEAEKRTADWAEPRPELGLSGNAGFVIGPRRLTDSIDLDGRSFLHSYDWATDPDGDALENIMTGPLVVCQMINAQYYFSTVDNEVYGSGSKTTHNTVGHVGVVQGNGGDLLMGLPLQSLFSDDGRPYHEPLRLSVVVHAPVEQVTEILVDNEDLATLFDNGWLSLTVLDPEQGNVPFEYQGELAWEPWAESAEETSETPVTAGR
ncbi:DUF2309 domain-containing protein [Haloplanus sp. C73]|uniref:DUF2309 domain-containing protein n=1 Tax=Haloplanus sp. C73 TaxID=3421641 RepID=UPI003EB9901D